VKFALLCMCICLLSAAGINADSTTDYSKGPLFGKNMFIPLLLHYNFPSLSAKSGEKFDFQYHLSTYYVQDVYFITETLSSERQYKKGDIIRDYESWVAEMGLAYNFMKQLQIGLDMRVFSYYGGFLDPVIESFHGFFNLPNAGREFFLQNQLYINIPNDNGIKMFLDAPVTSFGDIDLWGKWTFLENKYVSLGALGAFKLPTGNLAKLSGDDYPDAALGLLMDFRAAKYISIFAQAGAVIPFNGMSYPMFNGLLGLELHPWEFLSFNVQSNIKTSPISDHTIDYPRNPSLGTNFRKFTPQINILGGLIIRHKGFKFQFYFEEDAIIVYHGTDITFNMMISHTFSLKKHT